MGDRRAGRNIGTVVNGDGGDQGGVTPDEGVVPDDGRKFLIAVVIRGNPRSCPDIRSHADGGVSDIREVGNLRTLAHRRVLDFDERAGLAVPCRTAPGRR